MRTLLPILVVFIAASVAAAAPRELLDVSVPMRDGKSLAADVFLPAGAGPVPAIVIQTPYDRSRFRAAIRSGGGKEDVGSAGRGAMSDVRVLVDRERYAYVVVDWRGFYGSKAAMDGVRRRDLGADGYDAVEWVASRPWCDGKVGTWGGSALGKAQLQTAIAKPPHLVCAVPLIAALGQRYEFYYEGGVLREAHVSTLDRLGFGVSRLVRSAPRPERPIWRIARERTYTPGEVDVPCLFVTGWWDHYPDEIVETFEDIVANGGERARKHSKLLIGPWDHVSVGLSEQGDRTFPGARLASARAAKAFLDRWLLGEENGFDETARVRYWRVNEEGFIDAESFTGRVRDEVVLYPTADGALGTEPGRGDRTFVSDPTDPVRTLGGANLPPLPHGPTFHDALRERPDVLLWSTGPREDPLRLLGNVGVTVSFTADRPSVDLVAWLLEVRDGKTYHLADTARRVWDHEPGSRGRATLEFPGIAATVDELVLAVSSTNWPRYERNPGTGADRWDAESARPVRVTVHAAGSELRLPIEEFGATSGGSPAREPR